MSAVDTRRLKKFYSELRALKQKREEAQRMEYADPSPDIPEGYYLPAGKHREYREKALAYNKKLREYKRSVSKAWLAKKKQATDIRDYQRESEEYVSQYIASKPQRVALKQYIEQKAAEGPPAPSEDVLKRRQEGMPDKGVPGPGAGPRPGSVGSQLQQEIGETMTWMESPFKAVTGPIRGAGARLEELSLQASQPMAYSYEEPRYGTRPTPPSPKETQEAERIETGRKPGPATGVAAYGASVGADVLAAGVDVATFPVRPGLQAASARGLGQLALDAETREQFYLEAVRDPFRFTSTAIGGALLGQYLQETGVGLIETGVSRARTGIARRRFEAAGGDYGMFTEFERELGLEYPAAQSMPSEAEVPFYRRATVRISDLGDDVALELPYYVETESQQVNQMLREALDVEDEFNALIDETVDTAVPYQYRGEGGFLRVRGGYGGMKPFKKRAPTVPRSEQLTVSSKTRAPNTAIADLRKIGNIFSPNIVREVTTYAPGVDLRSTLLTAPKVFLPDLAAPSFSAFGVTPSFTPQLEKTRAGEAVKQAQRDLMKPVKAPSFDLSALRPFSAEKPSSVQGARFEPAETPRQTQFQGVAPVQVPEMEPMQEPEPITPPEPVTYIPMYPPSSPSYKPRPRKVKKKRKKRKPSRKRRGVFELRMDPVDIPDMEVNIGDLDVNIKGLKL